MTILYLFKIKTDQDQMAPDKDGELSQLLELVRSEDQEDGLR